MTVSDPASSDRSAEPRREYETTFSGLTYTIRVMPGDPCDHAVCHACDKVLLYTHDMLYQHSAFCPSKGWARHA